MPGSTSSEQDSQELHDKLTQLWHQSHPKHAEQMKVLANSRKGASNDSFSQKIATQIKLRDLEINKLKNAVIQLTNENAVLNCQKGKNKPKSKRPASMSVCEESTLTIPVQHKRAQSKRNRNCNNSEIHVVPVPDKAHLQSTLKSVSPHHVKISHNDNIQQLTHQCDFSKLSKQRLLQLLRNTSQYRQFVYYYDSHELSYLKRIAAQHRKNCNPLSQTEILNWGPKQLLNQFHQLNKQYKMGLNQTHMELILSEMKRYYEVHSNWMLSKCKQQLNSKLREVQRAANQQIPYELVQACRAKERQLLRGRKKLALKL